MEQNEVAGEIWVNRLSTFFVERSPFGAIPTILLTVGLVSSGLLPFAFVLFETYAA